MTSGFVCKYEIQSEISLWELYWEAVRLCVCVKTARPCSESSDQKHLIEYRLPQRIDVNCICGMLGGAMRSASSWSLDLCRTMQSIAAGVLEVFCAERNSAH
eukprot:6459548-Amphidinium_carterae.1